VPSAVRAQAKSTIDTVMDRLGDGSAGVLQLLITAGLGLGLRASLAVNFLLVGTWLTIAVRLKRAYVRQLFFALGQRSRPSEDVAVESDADARRTLEKILRDGDPPVQVAVLEWVARNEIRLDDQLLLGLVHDGKTPRVRNAALGLLLSGDPGELSAELMAELEREGQAVLVAAIDLLVESDGDRVRERLETLLDRAGETTRLSAVAFLLRRLGNEFEPFAGQVFDTLLAPDAPAHARAAAVRALVLLPVGSELRGRLDAALDDHDRTVVAAAAEVVAPMGRDDLIPSLIQRLADPSVRTAVGDGLTAFGSRAVEPLVAVLRDGEVRPLVRRQVPRLLGDLAEPAAVRALAEALDDDDPRVRERSLRALRAIRRGAPELRPVAEEWLETRVLEYVDRYERILEVEQTLRHDPQSGAEAIAWLLDALESERFRILDNVFRLLSLEYSAPEMARSWYAVRGGSPRERANALELLDNMLSKPLKVRIVGLLEPRGDRVARLWRGPRVGMDLREAVTRLVRGFDPWIGACGLYAARSVGATGLEEIAREAAGSEHAVLREEAVAYLATAGIEGDR
jgi:HEAT repeat protein